MTPADAKTRRLALEESLVLNASTAVSLGSRIREVRDTLGWSRRVMAEAVGVHVRTIVGWENNVTCPNWFYILLYVETTGVPWEFFFRGVAPTRKQVAPGGRLALVVPKKRWDDPSSEGLKRMSCAGSLAEPNRWGRCIICGRRGPLRRDGKVAKHRPAKAAVKTVVAVRKAETKGVEVL